MTFDVRGWLRQPSTITGIGALVATAAGAIAQALTHQAEWSGAVGLIAFSATHLAMNDNTAAASSVQKLVVDAVTAAAQKHLQEALPALVADGMAVVQGMTAPKPASAPASSVIVPAAGVAAALMLTAGLAGLSACSSQQQAKVVQGAQVACAVDGAIVPIAQPVIGALGGPNAAAAMSVDALLVHPAVVAACAQLGGAPVATKAP